MGTSTSSGINVRDVRGVVAELRGRGVRFEEYDYTVDGVTEAGPHVSARFKDSEGNLIGLMQTGSPSASSALQSAGR